jgi:hypothetical protein
LTGKPLEFNLIMNIITRIQIEDKK